MPRPSPRRSTRWPRRSRHNRGTGRGRSSAFAAAANLSPGAHHLRGTVARPGASAPVGAGLLQLVQVEDGQEMTGVFRVKRMAASPRDLDISMSARMGAWRHSREYRLE